MTALTPTPRTPKLSNGQRVRDHITGFEGIIICTAIWYNGCIRYTVQGQELKDGKPQEAIGFDEEQLDPVTPEPVIPTSTRKGGGPRPEPSRRV